MRKQCLGCVVLVVLVTGVWSQSRAQTSQKTMTVRPATKTYFLDGPMVALPIWDRNGYLIHFQTGTHERPLLWVYDAQGQLVNRISPIAPLADVHSASLKDVAMTKDGMLLVVVTLINSDQDKMTSGFLELDLKGTLKQVIKTDPFVPRQIAIDDAGNIWLLGYDWQRLRKDDNWAQVHKFSPEGKPLVATLSRSLFPKGGYPLDTSGLNSLYFDTAGDKVYAWLPGVNQLAVLGLDGQVLQLVDNPFGTLFGGSARSVEIRSLVFLPGDRLVVQALKFGKQGLLAHEWFFSTNLGRTWSPIAHQLADLSVAYLDLIGWTPSDEAVFIKLDSYRTGVLEFCPTVF